MAIPIRPISLPFQCPEVAISTAPGLPSEASQQSILVSCVVVQICGDAHHVPVLRETPPNSAETICHGGTCRPEDFEISFTPFDSVSVVAVVLFGFVATAFTSCWTSAGPPLLYILGFLGSGTTPA